MLLLTVILVFALVAGAVFVGGWLLDGKRSQGRMLHERLSSVQQAAARGASEELSLLRDELLSEIPALNRLLARSQGISRLQRFLSQADIKLRAGKFVLIMTLAGAICGLAAFLYTNIAFAGFLFGLGGLVLPLGYVSVVRSRRFHRFEELFPEAIDLLARAVRAGHAFPTALELIANEVSQPVSGEFRKLFEEQKFGLPMREALLNLAERMPLLDVKFFVTAVMLQRETGGNLAEILDKLSYVIRERFKILRQVRVHTAQGRLTMMILLALPPAVVIVLLLINRPFISVLFTDPLGHLLIVVGIVLQVLGFFVIRRIIQIQV